MLGRLVERGSYLPHAIAKVANHYLVMCAGRDEVQRMNATSLSDSIYPSDALFQSQRCPRNFEVYNETAAMVEVESFAGGVSREQ